jgi:hypothetical protein
VFGDGLIYPNRYHGKKIKIKIQEKMFTLGNALGPWVRITGIKGPCLRGFVEVATWGRLRMKSTCSLSVLIHRKLGNAFV